MRPGHPILNNFCGLQLHSFKDMVAQIAMGGKLSRPIEELGTNKQIFYLMQLGQNYLLVGRTI